MILKQTPEDFIVEEIIDETKLNEKSENKDYYYFKLKKRDYAQLKALEEVANSFNVSRKNVHFAGTKDKNAITTQIISIYGVKEFNLQNNIDFFNSKKDLEIEFIGKFNGRINLGDNLGNKFTITLRDLSKEEITLAKEKISLVSTDGVLNYFDSQRFGYANTSHITGEFVLKNDLKSAVYTILTSLPPNPSLMLEKFVKFIRKNWEKISSDDKEIIAEAIELVPNEFRDARPILNHLIKYKNDYPGAFRTLHKKLRTLYVSAYQSYLFNETIKNLKEQGLIQNYPQIELFTFETQYDTAINEIILPMLEKSNLTQESFKLPSMPELRPLKALRETLVYPKNLKILDEKPDNQNRGQRVLRISFELYKGAYATNVVKQLFT